MREECVLILDALDLLWKESRPLDSPSAYRLIVLLNEAGKLLKKIIVSRLIQNLNEVVQVQV